jgi:Na+/melibiose symporter-like transporter
MKSKQGTQKTEKQKKTKEKAKATKNQKKFFSLFLVLFETLFWLVSRSIHFFFSFFLGGEETT